MTTRRVPAGPDGAEEPEAVLLLRRQLARERARRSAAESFGERATSDLFRTVEELRSVQQELLESADRAAVVQELARQLRQELDAESLRERAAHAIGLALGADRCLLYVADPRPVFSDWAAEPDATGPRLSADDYGTLVRRLLDTSTPESGHVTIPDAADLAHASGDARSVKDILGVSGLALIPMWAGTHLVGAVVLMSKAPRSWSERELLICDGVGHELWLNLIQVHTHDQEEQVRRLEELDRVRDDFVANVSHELRTPLASINGYLEMVSDGEFGPLPRPVGHAIDIISRNSERLRLLVEDLLSFSVFDAVEKALELAPVELGPAVRACTDTLRPTATARDIVLDVDAAPDPYLIQGDRAQLERVVFNIVSNAVKFTPDGGRVSISLAKNGQEVVVEVSDTGIGIPADEQHEVFRRFFRSSLSVRAEMPGTGLGLALAKTIVDAHGGRISLASEEGHGTTVAVALPIGL